LPGHDSSSCLYVFQVNTNNAEWKSSYPFFRGGHKNDALVRDSEVVINVVKDHIVDRWQVQYYHILIKLVLFPAVESSRSSTEGLYRPTSSTLGTKHTVKCSKCVCVRVCVHVIRLMVE